MKKKTFVHYIGIVFVTIAIAAVTAAFSLIEQAILDSVKLKEASANGTHELTVVIDAGHGGEDGGAVGSSPEILEKNINLSIAIKLEKLFLLTDIKSVMTRNDDRLLCSENGSGNKKTQDLQNRVKIAESFSTPLFVSIHQNKFPLEKYKGLQVYYSKNNEDSKIFAELIQNKAVENLQKDNTRKIKPAGRNIYVLHKLTCPAVLVECGFLSNREEEALLGSDEYRQRVAFTVFSAVIDFIITSDKNSDV